MISVISVAMALMIASILLVTIKPPRDNSSINLDRSGVHEGDEFVYTLTGTYNGSQVTGTFLINAISDSSYRSQTNLTDPELNSTIGNYPLFGSGPQVGVGKYLTPLGVKDVVWVFGVYAGWASIYYVGANPGISYGLTVSGPNIHLNMVLDQTTNQWAKANNTHSFLLSPKEIPNEANEGGMGGIDSAGSMSGEVFYTENGGLLNYSLNATDVDVIGFSEGNVRSMAEGGPFAYDMDLYMLHGSRTTGVLEMPAGYYFIYFTGHNNTAGPSGFFHWNLTRY